MEGGWKDRLDDSRLVKVIARKREECGRISWWGEYDQLLRKYGLDDNERGSRNLNSPIAIRSALKRLTSSLIQSKTLQQAT